ncbi:MAG TPA: hypothetical protein ENG03_03815 [Thioploca sp.]|nr:hypothetical protein [Thioploca sp.]
MRESPNPTGFWLPAQNTAMVGNQKPLPTLQSLRTIAKCRGNPLWLPSILNGIGIQILWSDPLSPWSDPLSPFS